jgi:hypothetical protein
MANAATKEKPAKTKSKAQNAIEQFDSHLPKCPVKAGTSDRSSPIETEVRTAPAIRNSDGSIALRARRVRLTRCVECGGHESNDPKGDAFRAMLEGDDTEEV